MSEKNMIEVLRDFGLSKREAEIYIFLAKRGLQKVQSVAASLNMDRPQTYRALKNLNEKGAVEATLEAPTRYSAVPFDILIDSLVKTKKSEVDHFEAQKEKLIAFWRSISIEESEYPIAKFQVLVGKRSIHSKISQMIRESQKELLVLTTSLGVIQEDTVGIFDAIMNLARKKRNIQFRILASISKENLKTVKQIVKKISRENLNIEWRHIDLGSRFYPRFVIKDEEETILYTMPRDELSMLSQEETGLWINSKMFISTLRASFLEIWRNSIDANECIKALETGIPSEETVVIKDEREAQIRVRSVLDTAREEIMIILSSIGVNSLSESDLLPKYSKEGVKVRIMAPIDLDNLEAAQKLSEFCRIKHVTIGYLTMIVVDNRHLFIFKTAPLDEANTESEFYFRNLFYTNDQRFIERVIEALNDLWKRGIDISDITSEATMRMTPVEVSSSDTVLEVTDSMLRSNVSSAIVTENNKSIGIINERDILEKIVTAQKDPKKTCAKEVMSTPILTIDADEPLIQALKDMRDKGIERLAVRRKGKLIAMLREKPENKRADTTIK